jgi:hypothetical protein
MSLSEFLQQVEDIGFFEICVLASITLSWNEAPDWLSKTLEKT